MSKGKLVACLLAFCVDAAACQRSDDVVPTGREGRMRPEWGVVLTGEEARQLLHPCSRRLPADLSGAWTPGRAEIDRLESRLAAVLEHAIGKIVPDEGETIPAPTDYYRQYTGFYQQGQRVVYINGLHRGVVAFSRDQDSDRWTRKAMGGCDLGSWAFGLVYNVDADRFGTVDFDGRFNGPVRMKWF